MSKREQFVRMPRTKGNESNKISSGSVSLQTQVSSSSFSSQTSIHRVETKTFEQRSLSLSNESNRPRSTFDSDARPFSSSSSIISRSSESQGRFSPTYPSLRSTTRPLLQPAAFEKSSLSLSNESNRPRSIFELDARPFNSSSSIISRSSGSQSRLSPAYSSLRSNTRPLLEPTANLNSLGALSSLPTKGATTISSSQYKRPDEKRPPLSRSIFDFDARPLDPSTVVSQSSGYQSTFQRPISSYSAIRSTVPSTNRTEFSQNRDPRVPTYDTNGKKRGKALIINNVNFVKQEEERKGAVADEIRISGLFKKFGFDLKVYRNLKKSEMNDKINKYKSDRSLEKVDISVIIIMSHGHNRVDGRIVPGGYTQVAGTDEKGLPIDEVVSRFDSSNCPALKGKPKIFFFQCCRGEQQEKIHMDAAPIQPVVKQHADMLIAFSTLPGFFSLRDAVKGSWYIQSICDVFERHAKEFDVETLLKMVDEQLSKKHPQYQQTSSYESRGFKRCFLNPL